MSPVQNAIMYSKLVIVYLDEQINVDQRDDWELWSKSIGDKPLV